MENSFFGVEKNATYALPGTITKEDRGKVVKVSANKTAALCADGDRFFGILSTIDRDLKYGMVEEKGYQEVSYTGSIALGYQELVANGDGGVKVSAGGSELLVVDINTTDSIATIFFG